MKAERGFSTLEILIAMAVMFLVLGAVILVSFGNQTAVADSQTDAEAMNIAQGLLEQEQADARKDFNLVNSFATTSPDGFYHSTVTVEFEPDYLTKKVTAKVSWTGDHIRQQSVSLVTEITNFTNAVGANTCDSDLSGDWTVPTLAQSYDFASLVGNPGGTYPITDVDAYNGKLYVTTNNSSGPATQPTFFVFSIHATDPLHPTLSLDSKIDNDTTAAGGLNALAVATNAGGSYAYVANSLSKQFQIINLSGPTVGASLTVAATGKGNSIYYKDGYVYEGLTSAAGGKEFNLIDVHTPTAPVLRGGAVVGNDINQIFVKGLYAYVASPNTQQLKVYDVSNPASIAAPVGSYTNNGAGNGKSVYAVGDSLYLGTTAAGAYYTRLDASTPQAPSFLSSSGFSSSVDGIIVRDSLAFLLTKTGFQVINATSTAQYAAPLTLPSAGASALVEPTFDCENNIFYAAANDNSGNGHLYLITPKP